MNRCEEFRQALGRLHDGEASPGEARECRAHAGACADCAAEAALLDAVARRLRERGGPAPGTAAVPGLRDAVMARLRRGDAAVLEIHPFLRRAFAAAAAVFVAATAAAFWQSSHRRPAAPRDAGIPREEILAEIVRPRLGPGR